MSAVFRHSQVLLASLLPQTLQSFVLNHMNPNS
jgi:hypothetical protein